MYDRSKTIGASDAVHINEGNWAELFDRKTSPDSPSYPLPAELGHILEPFNRELFERDTGFEIAFDNEWEVDPYRLEGTEWCTYLPDGLIDGNIPFEAKAVNMMWKPENLLKKYMPQLQHAMRVMNAPFAYFSVIYLNTRYEWIKVEYDEPFDLALREREESFLYWLNKLERPPEYKGKRKGWV